MIESIGLIGGIVVFVSFGGFCFIMGRIVSDYLYGKRHYSTTFPQFVERMDVIISIADKNMRSGENHKRLQIKENVVVPYDDLLEIWDIADRSKMETLVK